MSHDTSRPTEQERVSVNEMVAAQCVFEARLKDHEGACYLGLPSRMSEAREAVHSALDAQLDARERVVKANKDKYA